MRVLFINTTCGRASHGKICCELAQQYIDQGHECKVAYGRESVPEQYQSMAVKIGSKYSVYSHVLKTRISDRHGFGSTHATKEFLKWADEYNPDLLWLHNIHGYYINIELLFKWIKSRPNMEVKWTLHDCWSFTGHCGYFTMAKCDKWRTECGHCNLKKDYPKSLICDNSRKNYSQKKELFQGVKHLSLITPSKWLADLTRKSFLKEYPVKVCYNKVNLQVFKPTESDFRKRNQFENKILVLGVANIWHERKGLKDILELACMLEEKYQLVLVGLNKDFLVKQVNEFKPFAFDAVEYQEVVSGSHGVAIPENVGALYHAITGKAFDGEFHEPISIYAIPKTTDQKELASIYSTADFYINPTHEDNYPTTNLEAQACGTWTITYDVGGSKETIK